MLGVGELALTEHLFRFVEFKDLLDELVEIETDPALKAQMAGYFEHHATASLDTYVDAVLAAKAEGLPVVLGLEVDYYADRMDEVARRLAGYPFDVLLGSVHWVDRWMFDVLDSPATMSEWDRRGTDAAWRAYTDALSELAETRTVDVLAHPDVIKVAGRRPDAVLLRECHERMAEAAASAGLAAELNSAGWRKPADEAYPAPSLLEAFFRRGVPVTTASDTHGPSDVAFRAADLAGLARSAGYGSLRGFRARRGHDVPIGAVVDRGA